MSDTNGAAAGAAGGAAGAAGAAGGTAGAAPWFTGKVDADVIAHWQNKGYDVNDPVKVSTELTKAYREAERLIGAPPAQVIRLPVDPLKDPDGMKAVFQRLGAPVDPKDYDFPSLKDKDGKVTDAALETTLRTAAADAWLPKEAAAKVAAAVTKHLADTKKALDAEVAAALTEEKGKLQANWGTQHDRNMVIAQNAVAALGVKPEQVATLEKSVGYAAVMEMFRNIGTKIGEAKFLKNPGDGGSEIMTREMAQARKQELMTDTEWVKRYNNGGKAELREMTDLNKLIVGDDIEGRF